MTNPETSSELDPWVRYNIYTLLCRGMVMWDSVPPSSFPHSTCIGLKRQGLNTARHEQWPTALPMLLGVFMKSRDLHFPQPVIYSHTDQESDRLMPNKLELRSLHGVEKCSLVFQC